MSLLDCPPCRGTGVLRQISIGDILATADLPDTDQPWETVPCPICDGGGDGAFLRPAMIGLLCVDSAGCLLPIGHKGRHDVSRDSGSSKASS